MKATIYPSAIHGSVTIPPSKSMSHRAIICAALAKGRSIISNVAFSDDINVTIDGMRQLGAHIQAQDSTLIIDGIEDFRHLQKNTVFCKESGSTLRFFIPIFSLCNQEICFTGQNRLLKRPQKIYADIFQERGLFFAQDEEAITIKEALPFGTYTLTGDVSSQFISGLLFALPLLSEDSYLHILPPFESRSYVLLTIQMLERFGIHVQFQDENTLYIPGNQAYQPCDYTIEGDFSQFAFFAVLSAIHGDLTINGMDPQTLQGDRAILSILQDCHVPYTLEHNAYHIQKTNYRGCDIDLQDCPDLGPILTVLGMYASSPLRIYNAARLRYKESDRIQAMEEELKKFHVDITSNEQEIFLNGSAPYTCEDMLYGHKDHRIVMSLAVAAICSQSVCTIDGAEAIRKSYPNFFQDLERIGIEVHIHDQ